MHIAFLFQGTETVQVTVEENSSVFSLIRINKSIYLSINHFHKVMRQQVKYMTGHQGRSKSSLTGALQMR